MRKEIPCSDSSAYIRGYDDGHLGVKRKETNPSYCSGYSAGKADKRSKEKAKWTDQ